MLTPEAERLWNWLSDRRELAGFILLGGSALSMHIGHRLSEDLDLAFRGPKLPVKRLQQLVAAAQSAEFQLRRDDDEAAVEEFLEGGMELHDYQQDFVTNEAVRLSFFTADPPLLRVLGEADDNGPRMGSLVELFKSKCLVCAQRSKTRDWFDLFVLMREHGFTPLDMQQVYVEAGNEAAMDSALARLCSGKAAAHDEGYAHLVDHAPDLGKMAEYFRGVRDEFEAAAAESKRQRG